MSKPIVTPRLKGLTPDDHNTLVASFQSIKPAIDAAVADAKTGSATSQQIFALQQQINALAAKIAGLGTVKSVGLSMPAYFKVTGSPVTSSGTLTATQPAIKNADGTTDVDQVQGTTSPFGSRDSGVWINDPTGPVLRGMKSRGAGVGAHVALQQGDSMLDVVGEGSDGVMLVRGGRMSLQSNGGSSAGLNPGAWFFYANAIDDGVENLVVKFSTPFDGAPLAEFGTMDLGGVSGQPLETSSLALGDSLGYVNVTAAALGIHRYRVTFAAQQGGPTVGTTLDFISSGTGDINFVAPGGGQVSFATQSGVGLNVFDSPDGPVFAVNSGISNWREIVKPTTNPNGGTIDLYAKADDYFYTLTTAGLERQLAYASAPRAFSMMLGG